MQLRGQTHAVRVVARAHAEGADHIHVCPLSHVERVIVASGARHVVTLVNQHTIVTTPEAIEPDNHLRLAMNDIEEPQDGLIMPGREHVAGLIEFVRRWDRGAPLLIHCLAGISRSTAGVFIALCALNPAIEEARIARRLRAVSATAMPNRRLVALADALLERGGRMSAALSLMAPARIAAEGQPFSLPARIDA